MTVYIDASARSIDEPEEGLIPCELVSISGEGANLAGAGWSIREYLGPLYDAQGNTHTREGLRAALLRDEARAIMAKLREAGELDELLGHASLLDRLLDALETVPLLREIIRRLREGTA